MKSLLLLFAVSMCCAIVNALYLIEDRGKLGKQFWGQNHTLMDGDNLTLHCGSSVNRNIKGYITNYWFWVITDRHLGAKKLRKENLLIRHSPQGAVRRSRPIGFRVAPEHIPAHDMQLINVNRYATGKYVCAVGTVYSEGRKRYNYVEGTFQNVLVKCKPRIESVLRTKIQLTDGDKLTLDCTSSGYPTPVITWRRIDGRPLPIRTITHSKGLLSIYDVGQLDRGQYQCTSSNALGNDTRIFNVDITVTAIIIKTKKSYANVGKDGAVECVAVGIPRPKFSWTWGDPGVHKQKLSAKEGLIGRFQVKTYHYFGNSTSYLMIKNVHTDDLRNYECRLKNGDINQKRTISLVGYSEPDSPIIQMVASYSRSIILAWKLGKKDGGSPLQRVIIQYQEFNNTKWQNETISANPRIVTHTIHRLKSSTRYTLRVIAVNDIGESRPSMKHSLKTRMNTEDLFTKSNKNENKEPQNRKFRIVVHTERIPGFYSLSKTHIINNGTQHPNKRAKIHANVNNPAV